MKSAWQKKSGEESSESGAQAHGHKQPAITASFASLTPLDKSSKTLGDD